MSDTVPAFGELDLSSPILTALTELGYETPSPIQAACIPMLLGGRDVLGMAQTGTGKTAAFALPLLNRIDLKRAAPQVLVLTPTRELSIQVAEAFQAYARHLRGFHVLPIYGGQNYALQLKQLKRGPQVVVGTPGRLLDHLSRQTLDLSGLQALVLDEADEMLRMGFIDDVEAIMAQTPEVRQTALFSATMPEQIQRISQRYMRDPEVVRIAAKTTTVENIEQSCWMVAGVNKLDALSRILEAEPYDGVIIFARTKTMTVELAEKLEARGYAAAALNGDMNQALRERTVARLKDGKLDIVIATDVAARGLDVERITLVINYDIPYDTEAYVHRIGRTGRAGRQGRAILFVAHRERHLLRAIERATRQPISRMDLPSRDEVTQKRISDFRDTLSQTVASEPLSFYQELSQQFCEEMELDSETLAAALLYLAQKERPLQLPPDPEPRPRTKRTDGDNQERRTSQKERPRAKKAPRGADGEQVVWETFRIQAGRGDGVQPKHIVGAIANEAELDSRYIGGIDIQEGFCTVQLPAGMPRELLSHLKKVRICGKPMQLERVEGSTEGPARGPSRGKRKRP